MSNKKINFYGEPETLNLICKFLNNQQPIIIQTDTQWGICATNPSIVNKLKKRNDKKVVRLINANYIKELTKDMSPLQIEFINQFWPGQVTIIYNNDSYRWSDSKYLNLIIDNIGELYCSSANITNQQPIQNVNDALNIFNTNEFDILLVETAIIKNNNGSSPSTIINLDNFKIIREGVKLKEVKSFITTNQIEVKE